MRRGPGIRYGILAAAAFVMMLMADTQGAAARDYGVDLIVNYGMKLPNGKVCRVILGHPHYHAGNAADRSKARSQRKAIKAWRNYTVFEYGPGYGSWAASTKKSMRCSYDREKRVWRCRAQSQPCLR